MEIIDSTNNCDGDALDNFFISQRNLETLVLEELTSNACSFFNMKEFSYDYKFNLKKLSVLFSSNYQGSIKFERNFGTFLINQTSLDSIKIEGLLPTSIYKIILSNNALNELEINASRFPQEKLFYENLHSNQNLKILKINSTITRENFLGLREFIYCQRDLKKLFLMDTDEFIANDLFSVISSTLINLTNLSILNLDSNYTPRASIKFLQYFSIKILKDINQWLSFIQLHENLETIEVGWIHRDFDSEVIRQLINFSNIKHMTFGGRFIANKKIYNAIKDDFKNLRTLKLRVSNYDEIKHLKFIFPLDQAQYEPKCLYFDENNDREPFND